uniref:hypothetical protein n=1 Tax=Enterobacter hormaechei TaxID=158836 RepID=UPI0019549CB1
ATMITVPTGSAGISEMLSIGSVDLADAQAADAQATDLPATDLQAANGAAAGREPAAARVAHD